MIIEDFDRHVAQWKAELAAFQATLTAALADGRGLRLTKADHTFFVTPNVGSDAPYRITSFRDDTPTGHMEFFDLESVAREAYGLTRQGYEHNGLKEKSS